MKRDGKMAVSWEQREIRKGLFKWNRGYGR